MAGKHKLDLLPKAKRDEIVRDIVLGRRSMWKVSQDLGIADTSVGRYMAKVSEEERLEIVARAAHDSKIAAAMQNAELVNELGVDTDKDLKFVLRELKALLDAAKGDDDRILQLGTLKELRQALMSLSELQGKLSRKIDVHLNLNESPQFLQLRAIILTVLDRHPEAKADFLNEMQALQVTSRALPR